ncbi:hypothetical protein SPRG_09472 [Saprolegnia parasitica CBS 223.65]|uniref:Uncharacterized protein n=1 Tax=Saprolegnia parasitica (strain CBS 223.65) TaxID=695850 RepID=A0A067C407_SAPPC|nr:hypothetical protein SPRG_09472 [Saprolegnia parasitica CBS 223.65]KDO25223.1 hypothetical protein SPRG_09472 [Saprolegnia parasitica CBS 223.65]|eukprot:XP_012204060.1 hypothetical protein SPRG_09472 [Saprolegnia parasitica CBS 223.65]
MAILDRFRDVDVANMEECVALHEVRRFFVRAGIYLATDETLRQARACLVAHVCKLQPLAQAAMESDHRMRFMAKDIRAAIRCIDPRMTIYGFDAGEDKPEKSTADVDDGDNNGGDESASGSDDGSDDDSDEDEETDRQVEEALGQDEAFGDGDFSDGEEAGDELNAAAFAAEDAMWVNEEGILRISENDAYIVSTTEQESPYLLPRSAVLRIWSIATNLPILPAALSALHSAMEHFLFKEMADGKLGSDMACTILQGLIMEQASTVDSLEAQVASQASELQGRVSTIEKLRKQLTERNVPRKSLALTDANVGSSLIKDKLSTPRKRLSSDMLQENQVPTPQALRYTRSSHHR